MGFASADSESEKYVCLNCIGDHIIKAEIQKGGRRRRCSYCGDSHRSISIEQLADRVDGVYSALVGEAELVPSFSDDSDSVEYRQNGSTPSEIVAEMLECAYDNVASDVVEELSSRHSYRAVKDGDIDRYDDSSDTFKISIPKSPEIKEIWETFCKSIKHSRRFFNEEASSLLAEILEPIVSPKDTGAESAVRVIEPGSDEGFVYRGRMANTFAARAEFLAKPINSLGTPPRELNSSGRMNSAGIPVFYGSFDVPTCVAELRAPVGGSAVVGKFEIIRPLRILDLTLLENAMFNISYFDRDLVRKYAYNRFLRGFHNEIKKPVIPDAETLDYLPTQFVAEYLWTKVALPIDGLIYGSAQISEATARNIAIFPHASQTEGWLEELHPKGPTDTNSKKADAIDFVDFFQDASLVTATEAEAPDVGKSAFLRLITKDTIVANVRSIEYELRERSVAAYNLDAHYNDYEDDGEFDPEDE